MKGRYETSSSGGEERDSRYYRERMKLIIRKKEELESKEDAETKGMMRYETVVGARNGNASITVKE